MASPAPSLPIERRIPPWQIALLFLLTAACAALNLYGRPNPAVRTLTIGFGLLALGAAVVALRMYLVVDENGIGVRRLLSESSADWSDIAQVDVARGRMGGMTLRVVRTDNSVIAVPPSLVLPSRPMSTPRVYADLSRLAEEIMAAGHTRQRRQ